MPFEARVILPDTKIPARGYLHESGLYEVFGDLEHAGRYLRGVLDGNGSYLNPADFIIAVAWGRIDDGGKTKVAEMFRFSRGKEEGWLDNHGWKCTVFENGIYILKPKGHGCEDILHLLDRESSYRVTTSGVEEFMAEQPDLGNIEPKDTLTVNQIIKI